MKRLMLFVFFSLLAGPLVAQATFALNGTVQADEEHLYLLEIDFGTSTSAAITVNLTGNSATFGLSAFIGDLDTIAASGSTGAADQGSDAGTGTINLSVTSPTYSGVHEFVLAIRSDTGGGPVVYNGSVDAAALSTGDITQGDFQAVSDNGFTTSKKILDRAFQSRWGVDSTGDPEAIEFLVDFGTPAQAITFWVQGEGDITGDLEVFEVLANGSTSSLGTLSGTGDWGDEGNFTTSSRSGIVRIRVTADTADMGFNWTALLPATATVADYAEFNLTGSLGLDEDKLHRVTLDFGASTNSVFIQFSQFIETDLDGFAILNPNVLATTGSSGFLGAEETNYVTGQGLTDIIFLLTADDTSPATYNIIVQISLAPADATAGGSVQFDSPVPFQSFFGRAVRSDESASGATTITREFNVDYGGTTHTADLWFQAGSAASVTVELFEIDAVGTPQSLATLTPNASDEETNVTTSARDGVVTFRVEITTTGAADIGWSIVFDDSVTVASFGPGGGGGGGGDDGGCTTGTGTSNLLGLLAVLALLVVGVRLRRVYPIA